MPHPSARRRLAVPYACACAAHMCCAGCAWAHARETVPCRRLREWTGDATAGALVALAALRLRTVRLRRRAAAQVDEAVRPHAGHSGNGQPCMQHATCTLAGRRLTAARTAAHAAKTALRCAVCCAASCMPHGGTVCGTPQARACGAHRRKPHGTAADTVQHPHAALRRDLLRGTRSLAREARERAARVMAGDAAGGWEYPV